MSLYFKAARLMELFVGPPLTEDGVLVVSDHWAEGWKFRLYSRSDGDYDISAYHHERGMCGPELKRGKTDRVVNSYIQPWIVEEVVEILQRATVLQRLANT